jgi:hypothetical protein
MPIKKFTSFNEASKALWELNPDIEYYERMKRHFDFWSKLSKQKSKAGVQKFRSYEDLLKAKEKEQLN